MSYCNLIMILILPIPFCLKIVIMNVLMVLVLKKWCEEDNCLVIFESSSVN